MWKSSVSVKFEACQEIIQVCFNRVQLPWTQPLKLKKKAGKMYVCIFIYILYIYVYICILNVYILNNNQYTKTQPNLFWKVLNFFDTLCATATFSMNLSSLKFCKDFNLGFLPSHHESHYAEIISGYVTVCSIFQELF